MRKTMSNTRPTPKLDEQDIIYSTFNGEDSFSKTIKCTYFLIVLFSEGNGVHFIDDHEYPINRHQLHFLFPGQHHHWETGPGTIAQQIVVGKKVFEEFLGINELFFIKHNLHPVFKFNEDIHQSVCREMKAIEHDLRLLQIDKNWKSIIHMRMNILSSMMKQEAEEHIDRSLLVKLPQVVRQFWSLIQEHYKMQKTIYWYAERLCISPNYLNILCKKSLNISASEMLDRRVLQDAKQQLRFSDKTIKEIGFDLGFKSLASFSTFFRKKTSFSPSQYKE
ncbi:MAG: helix-turn-helix domain-containing protein [Chitinophagaceae bacterium]|nr:helix-turn-helix domain-containing protein [Chitinophagaceae bacterium]